MEKIESKLVNSLLYIPRKIKWFIQDIQNEQRLYDKAIEDLSSITYQNCLKEKGHCDCSNKSANIKY